MTAEHALADQPPSYTNGYTNGHRYWLTAESEQDESAPAGTAESAEPACDNPVQHAVRAALEALWETLEGDQPNNLYDLVISQIERPLLETAMLRCGQNQSKAAECLGINRSTLRKKLRQHRLIDTND
ncbi:helix-turn-helix domain-containing protein [Halothiobacillus diazotrophicus]|uniref:helix-turn-helix domain-containing protein n=1 Tax=Halothiobacillus diazotrophicus TaxID=1860122 RepID=UPI0009EF5EB3|nr:helix-turn-helix domain-containing protein [Halothiobacillus diazotrophicus]